MLREVLGADRKKNMIQAFSTCCEEVHPVSCLHSYSAGGKAGDAVDKILHLDTTTRSKTPTNGSNLWPKKYSQYL